MHFSARALLFSTLVAVTSVRAQLSAVATGYTPNVSYSVSNAFVFCSGQDCTGTCEVVDTNSVPRDDAEAAPGDMGFQSIYWYDPGNYAWILYTCLAPGCGNAVEVGPNTCYNLYDNGVPTDFYTYYYFVNVVA